MGMFYTLIAFLMTMNVIIRANETTTSQPTTLEPGNLKFFC
jgi:hypothetical protein